ncbi:MAG: FAD-dependent oxidoreductase [Coriobacteriia bacterium]|nr:FAD-dependent oxidoreductase [Coriobacteriia bacterium]MBN2847777.1 FAD-dependent oxidoreductase [Coriobacteriia bacterium]
MDTAQARPEHYDLIVVGAGPAGLTAGMYAVRQGLTTAIVGAEVGGQAAWASEVENYLGWRLVTGSELVTSFREHVAQFDIECLEGQLVNAIVPAGDGFEVFTREGAHLAARAIIVATGRTPNRLAVPGETEFIGRGVSYCATCDGAFFRGMPVAVVGSTESACDAALELAALEATVTVVSASALKAHESVLEKVAAEPRITVRTGLKPTAVIGDDRVTGLAVRDATSGAEETLAVSGVFIETGSIPVSEFTGGLVEVTEHGEIVVDRHCRTSTPGIYAAGDVTDGLGKQIIIAAGEGARAAIAASRDLKRR